MVHHLVLTDGFSSGYRLMITKIALMIFHNGYMQSSGKSYIITWKEKRPCNHKEIMSGNLVELVLWFNKKYK